ncbi:MAG: hypothetical protein DWQ34_07030 [Planctomycetota bacterium]|nr:MAG: hypothetical protein DWQ29_21530 [Planctomycetota bacterium]REJ95102.1 MAG: hypothetical protein DWQ34_07030 [Planctomycetota bacterium]REK21182.1 MAG: hypothetical protein DWQ41_22485 [Planctomycetota bacterium]REK29590.1 MAG: hypothetical protein DWQ45_22520 [Planctomycetota bacterium]
MNLIKYGLALFAATILASSPARADDENPYLMADETWISIDGTVESVSANSFELDYGTGIVTVEMDDGDRDADGYKFVKGDKVRVSGMVDDDLYETTTIEASSVYVENLGTYFYASAIDDEDVDTFVTYTTPIAVSGTVVQGIVTDVETFGSDFVINTGERSLTVDTDKMPYDPLDDEGYQKIEVGDRVSVTGDMERKFFEGREFSAESIVTLVDADDS